MEETKKLSTGSGANPQPPRSGVAVPVVILLGIGFIFASISQLGVLVDLQRYRSLSQHLPESLAHLRYMILWGTSLLGVITGIGLLNHQEFFRKTGVLLTGVSIVDVFWKHSHEWFLSL